MQDTKFADQVKAFSLLAAGKDGDLAGHLVVVGVFDGIEQARDIIRVIRDPNLSEATKVGLYLYAREVGPGFRMRDLTRERFCYARELGEIRLHSAIAMAVQGIRMRGELPA